MVIKFINGIENIEIKSFYDLVEYKDKIYELFDASPYFYAKSMLTKGEIYFKTEEIVTGNIWATLSYTFQLPYVVAVIPATCSVKCLKIAEIISHDKIYF